MRSKIARLRDALARRLATGERQTGPPSDSASARDLGMSRGTVRKVRESLEREHAVTRKRGSIEFAEGLASAVERSRLQLGHKDRVYRISRVRAAEGGDLVAERAVLPAALFPALADKAELAGSILDIAEAYGVQLGEARERVFIAAASAWASKILRLDRSAPVLVLDRIVMTQDRRPAEWRIAERKPRTT